MFLVGVGVGVIVGLAVAAWGAVLLVALDPVRFRKSTPPRRAYSTLGHAN
jgi:hypothetical protein